MKKEEFINEEDYDRMKDRRMERGGVGGNQRSGAKFAAGPKKSGKKYDGMGALDFVKKQIRAKHGHGAIVGEGKEKGLDGKACWKGYKLAGTKKKGGKTVDNCVKEARKIASRQTRRPCTTVLRRYALNSGVLESVSTDNTPSLMLRVTSHGMT